MATKKKPSSKRGQTGTDINLRAAMASGKNAAEDVIASRAKQLRRRAAVEKALPTRRRALSGPPRRLPAKSNALFGSRKSVGVLVAEGDSWFDYPMQDVLGLLEDDYLYDVESVAHKGDCVEDIAHATGQFTEFTRRLEKVLGEGKVPRRFPERYKCCCFSVCRA